MFSRLQLAAVLAVSVLLCSCASQPEIPFDKSQAANIKTIGILTPSMPEKPAVWLASDVGQSFGLIGALVDAGMQANREAAFWKSIDGDKNPPRAAFLNALAASLHDHGFEVKQIAVNRPDDKFLKTYPEPRDGVDAYLDVVFAGANYGYVAAGIGKSTPYRPYAYVNCRLVRASDGATLMQDIVLDNSVNVPKDVVTVSANPDYSFTNFDALNGDPNKAVAGMNDAFRRTADSIGNLLR